MEDIRFLYVTVGNEEEAKKIAHQLVKERFAACVNLFPNMQSFFWWEGAVQSEQEVVLIVKTTLEKVPDTTNRIKELHSYSCPCVVALPVVGGNAEFLDWIIQETKLQE